MDLDKLTKEYENDINWSFNNTDTFLQTLPLKISKYQGYWFKLKQNLDKIDNDYDDLWITRYVYYKNDYDIKLSATEIKDFLSKDVELNKLKKKQKHLITIIEYLEKILKNFDNMRWDISRVIDFEKFKAGVL